MSASAPAPPARITRRRALAAGAFVLVALSVLYVAIPRLAGLDDTWRRLATGDPWWLAVAFALELGSFAGYVVLFRLVFGHEREAAVGWRLSWRITLAGVAASRLLAAGGAGGVVLTAWALGRAGIPRRRVARRMAAFLVLLYAVYVAALLLGGVGLRSGVLNGPAPFGLTVVPALFAAAAIAAALLARRVPVLGEGVGDAVALLRARDVALLGAIAWWALDVGALWACLAAFGDAPPGGVVVMAYFVGTLANLLPLPGGVGAVEGGVIGTLVGFGSPAGLAIAGVLAYRAFSLWLPTFVGVVAYVQLTRAPRRAPALTPRTDSDGA
jgi:uncharacterized membrane protein YbhN (UPF0104 family)